MGTRGMRIARNGQASHDSIAVDGDEDRRIGVATNGAQVSALVGGAPPGVGRQQPVAWLASRPPSTVRRGRRHLPARRDGSRSSDDASEAAAPRVARRAEDVARSPLDRGGAAEEEVGAAQTTGSKPSSSSASATPSGQPPSTWTVSPSTWSRGREIASSTARPWRTTPATTWRIAPASRTEPALPTTSRGSSSVEHERRSHHAREPGTRVAGLVADHVELAEHVVQLEAVAEDARPEPSVEERATAAPSPSTTETFVVPVGRDPLDESGGAAA